MKKAFRVFLITSLLILMIPMLSVTAFSVEPPTNLEAPQNLIVEIKEHANGKPYFEAKWTNPQSILDQIQYWDEQGEAPLGYQIDMKVGNQKWNYEVIGNTIPGNSLHAGSDETGNIAVNAASYDPINAGELDNVDIKANVYYFRLRLSYDAGNEYIYSPFSNIVSKGVAAFYGNASSWATNDLDKAMGYGFITDRIKDNMKGSITREEFAEVIVKFYEKFTGTKATYTDMSAFSDTTNPEVFKAYENSMVSGVGNSMFAPSRLVKREEMAGMLNRSVKAVKPDADFNTVGAPKFPDDKLISGWAQEVVRFATKNNIIRGLTDGRFDPQGTTSREQAIIMVVRTYDQYK